MGGALITCLIRCMLPAPAGLGWGCITGGRIGSIGGGLTGGDRRVHHWVQHRTRHRASGEGVKMVAPVASANRASAERRGQSDNNKCKWRKEKMTKRRESSNNIRHYSGIGAGVVLVVRWTCGR